MVATIEIGLFLLSGCGGEAPTATVMPTATPSGTSAPMQAKWKFSAKGDEFIASAIYEDAVYFGGQSGRLYAVDIQTGQEKWNFKSGDLIFFAPTVKDGVVFFGSNDDVFTL